MTLEQTLQQRGKQHGDFTDNAAISQALKEVIKTSPGYSRLNPVMRESLDMILHKISRIIAGDPTIKDHWLDISGYATLVHDRL